MDLLLVRARVTHVQSFHQLSHQLSHHCARCIICYTPVLAPVLAPVLGPVLGPLSRVDAWSAFTSPILLRFSTLHIVHILYIYYSTFSVSDAIICAAYLIRHDYDSI